MMEKTLEGPLDYKEIKHRILSGRTYIEAEAPTLTT